MKITKIKIIDEEHPEMGVPRGYTDIQVSFEYNNKTYERWIPALKCSIADDIKFDNYTFFNF